MWNKKNVLGLQKIIFWLIILSMLLVALLFRSDLNIVSANPDYICIKAVYNQPCNVTSCQPWQSGYRYCTWWQATSVYYYQGRTDCEPGYYQYKTSDAWLWASWRKNLDNPYETTACSVYQYDNIPPIWVWTNN